MVKGVGAESQAARERCSPPAQAAAQASLLSAVRVVELQGWLLSTVLTCSHDPASGKDDVLRHSCMLRVLMWPFGTCHAGTYVDVAKPSVCRPTACTPHGQTACVMPACGAPE